MKASHLVGLVVVAGAFGAIAGGVAGAFSMSPAETEDSVLLTRLSDVAKGIDALRDAAAENRDAVADVSERIVAVELEVARQASARESARRTAGVPGLTVPEWTTQGGPGGEPPPGVRDAIALRTADLTARMKDMRAATGMQHRFAKGMKIRAMPEEERWQYAADTLGLNSVQVDEIRGATDVLQEAIKGAVTKSTTTTAGGATVMFHRVDGAKMAEARKTFSERVDNALNDEQKKSWKEEGFANAMGRGRRTSLNFSGDVRITNMKSLPGDGVVEVRSSGSIKLSQDDE